jgi:hypothetical protein
MTLLSTRISPPRPNAAWPALWGPTRTAQAPPGNDDGWGVRAVSPPLEIEQPVHRAAEQHSSGMSPVATRFFGSLYSAARRRKM